MASPLAGTTPAPRLLAVGHVTWDLRQEREVLGGSVSYAALAARRLGWNAAVLTTAGPEFEPQRDLPGVEVFLTRARTTTRFRNIYEGGHRRQLLASRSGDIDLTPLPEEWRSPDALLLAPVAGELGPGMALSFAAGVVGVAGQGFLRDFDAEGLVSPRPWTTAAQDLEGAHVVFVSEHDLPAPEQDSPALLSRVPVVALTRGWRGLRLLTPRETYDVASLPREEVDPTGAGDVFAAAFLVRYHETADLLEAAAFAACAASCAVEGVGTTSLGDRAEVGRRLLMRERMIEEGEWQE